jgi:hypothetical protein
MTRRIVGAIAWLLIAAMNALWVWAVVGDGFLDAMFASLSVEDQRLARYDAERTATDFADRLRDEVDLASVSGDIVGVVDTALRPTTIGVWIRPSTSTTP